MYYAIENALKNSSDYLFDAVVIASSIHARWADASKAFDNDPTSKQTASPTGRDLLIRRKVDCPDKYQVYKTEL